MGDPHAWTDWDLALAYSIQVIEDFTDQYGLLAWEVEDEAIQIDAVRKIHPFKESVDLVTKGSPKRPYQPAPGEYFVPDMWSRRKDGSIQTFSEWVESTVEKPE